MNVYEWLKLKYGEKIDEKEPIRLFRGKQLKKYLERVRTGEGKGD